MKGTRKSAIMKNKHSGKYGFEKLFAIFAVQTDGDLCRLI